ncbi:hypothetical protein HDU67_008432 [Dinochytrium kinnereticum]|nr:hypothetical protein HDU67_008432 [Dinochytrium kinnereticum]
MNPRVRLYDSAHKIIGWGLIGVTVLLTIDFGLRASRTIKKAGEVDRAKALAEMLGLRSSSRLAGKAMALQRRNASSASESAQKLASGVTGRLTALATPLVYYGKVAFEFGRQVAVHQKITIPTPASIGEAQLGIANFISGFQNGAWKKVTLRQAGSLVGSGVTIYGFFLVGEMIGRGSVIGYDIPG